MESSRRTPRVRRCSAATALLPRTDEGVTATQRRRAAVAAPESATFTANCGVPVPTPRGGDPGTARRNPGQPLAADVHVMPPLGDVRRRRTEGCRVNLNGTHCDGLNGTHLREVGTTRQRFERVAAFIRLLDAGVRRSAVVGGPRSRAHPNSPCTLSTHWPRAVVPAGCGRRRCGGCGGGGGALPALRL
jgi:hypothetical protein